MVHFPDSAWWISCSFWKWAPRPPPRPHHIPVSRCHVSPPPSPNPPTSPWSPDRICCAAPCRRALAAPAPLRFGSSWSSRRRTRVYLWWEGVGEGRGWRGEVRAQSEEGEGLLLLLLLQMMLLTAFLISALHRQWRTKEVQFCLARQGNRRSVDLYHLSKSDVARYHVRGFIFPSAFLISWGLEEGWRGLGRSERWGLFKATRVKVNKAEVDRTFCWQDWASRPLAPTAAQWSAPSRGTSWYWGVPLRENCSLLTPFEASSATHSHSSFTYIFILLRQIFFFALCDIICSTDQWLVSQQEAGECNQVSARLTLRTVEVLKLYFLFLSFSCPPPSPPPSPPASSSSSSPPLPPPHLLHSVRMSVSVCDSSVRDGSWVTHDKGRSSFI